MTSEESNKVLPQPTFKRKFRKFSIIFFISLTVITLIYYFICGMTYSEGTRSGVLTKVTKKGYLFKTYEGEMNVGGFSQGDGTIMPAVIFVFSVTDKKIYEKLHDSRLSFFMPEHN